MATDSAGMQMIAGGKSGAYYLLEAVGTDGAQIIYLDYATRQQIPWSNQMTVTQDETNPGWIPDRSGGVRPMVAGETLYVAKYGRVSLPKANFEGWPTFLYRMAADGTARKTITLPRDILLEMSTGVATDGDHLYLLASSFDDKGFRDTYYLYRTDFEKEKMVELHSMEAGSRYHLVGVYSHGLVLQQTTLDIAYKDLSYEEQIQHYEYRLLLYSLADNTLVPTDFTWAQGELSCVFGHGMIYYLATGSRALYRYDLATGKRSHLLDISTPEIGEDWAVGLSGEDYGDHLLAWASGEKEGESAMLGIDLATGKTSPMTLSYEYDMGEMPVYIQAQTDTQFLVSIKMEDRATTVILEGNPHTIYPRVTTYALIDKADYWANRPNYILFEDHVYN